jgi:hypothetical protein
VSGANEPVTLVMTATIQPPPGMPGTARSDPGQRRGEYLAAFQSYLDIDDGLLDQIVIFENSDADLSDFAAAAEKAKTRKKIQLITTPSDYPADRGKGYGEFLMMDWGISELTSRGAIDQTTKMWKVTGRLNVRNIATVLRTAPKSYAVYCDLRNVPVIGESLGGNRWMELRLFSFTLPAYNALFRGQYGVGMVLEKEFFPIVDQVFRSKAFQVYPRFRTQPVFEGFSGFSNASYTSFSYRMKNAIRRFGRSFAPWVWL